MNNIWWNLDDNDGGHTVCVVENYNDYPVDAVFNVFPAAFDPDGNPMPDTATITLTPYVEYKLYRWDNVAGPGPQCSLLSYSVDRPLEPEVAAMRSVARPCRPTSARRAPLPAPTSAQPRRRGGEFFRRVEIGEGVGVGEHGLRRAEPRDQSARAALARRQRRLDLARAARSTTARTSARGRARLPRRRSARRFSSAAAASRATRSSGRNGASHGAVASQSKPCASRVASAAATPASGPPPAFGAASATTAQAQDGEARRVAVGVDEERVDLRREPRRDMGDERPTGERRQRLVDAHAGRSPARQHDARRLDGARNASPQRRPNSTPRPLYRLNLDRKSDIAETSSAIDPARPRRRIATTESTDGGGASAVHRRVGRRRGGGGDRRSGARRYDAQCAVEADVELPDLARSHLRRRRDAGQCGLRHDRRPFHHQAFAAPAKSRRLSRRSTRSPTGAPTAPTPRSPITGTRTRASSSPRRRRSA